MHSQPSNSLSGLAFFKRQRAQTWPASQLGSVAASRRRAPAPGHQGHTGQRAFSAAGLRCARLVTEAIEGNGGSSRLRSTCSSAEMLAKITMCRSQARKFGAPSSVNRMATWQRKSASHPVAILIADHLLGYSCVFPVREFHTLKLPSALATTLKYAPSLPPFRFAIRGAGLLCAASESSAVCSI